MKTENLITESVCEYLKTHHMGKDKTASSKTLEAVFHLNGSKIRKSINALRCLGFPICSDKTGYYYADNKCEIRKTITQLNSRIMKISKARNGLLCSISSNRLNRNTIS